MCKQCVHSLFFIACTYKILQRYIHFNFGLFHVQPVFIVTFSPSCQKKKNREKLICLSSILICRLSVFVSVRACVCLCVTNVSWLYTIIKLSIITITIIITAQSLCYRNVSEIYKYVCTNWLNFNNEAISNLMAMVFKIIHTKCNIFGN